VASATSTMYRRSESATNATGLAPVRLGVSMKLLPDIGVSRLNHLLLWTQIAHLEKRAERQLDKREREIERAALIREILDRDEDGENAA